MLTAVALVSGTWGRSAKPGDPGSYSWWKPPSVFIANLKNAGLWLPSDTDYFDWSTAEDNQMSAIHNDWETAGKALYWYWVSHGRDPLSLIAHSHGGQVVAYALAYALALGEQMFIEHLITAGTPVRADMQPHWNAIVPMIHDWTHIYADEVLRPVDGDLGFQMLGSLPLDDTFGFKRQMPQAKRNIEVLPAVTHHGLVAPRLWNEHNFWQYLQT